MFNKIRMLFNKNRVASKDHPTSAQGGKLIPSPGMQIREISVTGVLEGREKFVHQLSLNSKLTVRRDLENPADPKAVCVTNANGDILGFIPQKYAHPIAEKMDAEEWVPECVIVRLERSPDGKILALRLALSIPAVLCTDNSTPLLEFTCAPGSTGAMYIMLNCEASLLNVLLEKLKQNGVECAKFGTAARREIGGHNCANDQIMRPIFAENRVTHHNWVSNWKPGRSVTYGKHNEGQTPAGVEAQTVPG